MQIFVPKYYKKFKCLADKCVHSCCVGWEIDVDEETLRRHRELSHPISSELISALGTADGAEYISLTSDGRCPFLDGCGLCRIISTLGDCYTSKICREHPRFYHKAGDRIEGGIGAVCEAAADIILSSDDYDKFVTLSKESCEPASEGDAQSAALRDEIYSVLKNSVSFSSAREEICRRYGINKEIFVSEQTREVINSLELLNGEHRRYLEYSDFCDGASDKYAERFFAYLVYRHVSVAKGDAAARIAFALLLSGMLCYGVSRPGESVGEAMRIISEEIEYCEDNADSLIFELYLQL